METSDASLLDADRPLDPTEFARLVAMPLTPEAAHEILELRCWFLRRYPAPLDRFAYLRRKRNEWLRPGSRR